MTVAGGPPTAEVSRTLRPAAADLVDVAFGVTLASLGVVGFRSSFGGGEQLDVGVPAVVAGAACGYAFAKLRVHLLVSAAAGAVVFFLLGGAIALRGDAAVGVLPTPAVFEGLVDGSINGWARLLTTVPPAGHAGNLLAVPYLAGFAGGLLAVAVAIALPRWPACVLPPAAVLGVSVLLGVEDPASLLLQGAVFGAATVAWLSLRTRRIDPALVARSGRPAARGLAMLGVAVVGAFAVGPNLPGADANERFLLRDRFEPPFDPSKYPSPLARFRDFHGEDPIDEPLFSVEGLPKGAVIRFAVMDDYDGYVWRASPPGTAIGGDYLRVGERIPRAAQGERATLTFEMGALANLDSVWIPTSGSPTSITFPGGRAEALSDAFRFNRETETAASPDPLRPGDTWTVEAAFPRPPDTGRLAELPVDPSLTLAALPGASDEVAGRVAGILRSTGLESASPWERIVAVRDALRTEGGYSDGAQPAAVPAGHGLARLGQFLTGSQPVGNGEQFAAGLAFLARAMGVPARVVLEFHPEVSGGRVDVMAADTVAVVEVGLADVGWVPLGDPTPPEDQKPRPDDQVSRQVEVNEIQPPPPTTVPPGAPLLEEQQRQDGREEKEDTITPNGGGGVFLRVLAFASVPLSILVLPALAVVALKARRRRRRRTLGSPGTRIAAGWSEVVDLARDTGAAVPPRATRREVARFLAAEGAERLAAEADHHVFGRAEPTDDDAEAVWLSVEAVRDQLTAPLRPGDRLRAAVALTSLRRV